MLLRKSRKHLHGSSNRVNTDANFHSTFYKPISHAKKESGNKNSAPCTTSYLQFRKVHKKENSFNHGNLHTHPQEGNSAQTEIESKLRKIYQGRKNMVKAIDGWGFDSTAYISRDTFKQKLSQKLGSEPTEEQVSALLLKYAHSQNGINAQQFISMIHRKTEGSMFNETLFPFDHPSKLRNLKIDNLKQNLKVYAKDDNTEIGFLQIDQLIFKINSSISKMRHRSDGGSVGSKQQFFNQLLGCSQYCTSQKDLLHNIEKVIDYDQLKYNIETHKTIDHLFIDPILRKTQLFQQKAEAQQNELFLDRMVKTSPTSYKQLRNSQKKFDYDPTSMLNTNQQKTRFGKHFFTKESHKDMPSTAPQARCLNQKELILETIKSQSDIQKQRYANKLQKIREFQLLQKQSIARREQQALGREEGRMRRMRNEQQAYNYVNFIKKRWE